MENFGADFLISGKFHDCLDCLRALASRPSAKNVIAVASIKEFILMPPQEASSMVFVALK